MPLPDDRSDASLANEASTAKAASQAAPANKPVQARPPGEVGGHTVQAYEQTTPSAGAARGISGTSRDTPAPGEAHAVGGAAASRPPRPPVRSGEANEASASDGTPSGGNVAAPQRFEPQALVAAVSRRIAENFAKAIHQSIEEAVRDCLGQSSATAPRQPNEPERQRSAAERGQPDLHPQPTNSLE